MEVVLTRQDLAQVSTVSGRPLALMSGSKKKLQKILVGDDVGSVHCFAWKKGEAQLVFKTPGLDAPASAVCITTGAEKKKEKVFFSSGQQIKGITKKGREFFKFTTELSEKIRHMYVEDAKMWTTGDYIYNSFVDTKDTGFYMCKDRINDLILDRVTGGMELNALLGCQDRYIRVLQGPTVYYETTVDGAVTALHKYSNRSLADLMTQGSNVKECLYGTENGLLGQMLMSDSSITRGFVVSNPTKLGGVSCLSVADFLKKGKTDVLVGRDDGYVQVFDIDTAGRSEQLFSRCVGESISTMKVGTVTSQMFEEIIAVSYSGKVISFTSEPQSEDAAAEMPHIQAANIAAASVPGAKGVKPAQSKEAVAAAAAAKETALSRDARIRGLRVEIDKLRKEVDAKKQKFSSVSTQAIAVSTRFRVKEKFVLLPDEACHALSLEIEMPLDCIALQCDAPIQLLDPGPAVPSLSPPDPENNCQFLATLRIQDPISRLEIKLRITEGQVGTLIAYVIPRIAPKTAQSVSFPVKPLALHERVPKIEPDRPYNELRLTGQFALADIHAWVVMCLPEVPTKVPSENVELFFRSTFLGTMISAKYQKGEAVFRSDSVSSLAIIKDVTTREATARKLNVNVKFDSREESVPHFLQLLHPMLDYQKKLTDKVGMLDALKELSMQEGEDGQALSAEHKETLDKADQLLAEHKLQPRKLEFLHGILDNLYVNRHKFRGNNVRGKLPDLHRLLKDYDLDAVTAFIMG